MKNLIIIGSIVMLLPSCLGPSSAAYKYEYGDAGHGVNEMYYGRPLEDEAGWFGQVNYQNRAGLITYTGLDKNESFGALRAVGGYQGRIMYASVAVNYSMGQYYWGQSDLNPEWTSYRNYGIAVEYGFAPITLIHPQLQWRPIFFSFGTGNERGSYQEKLTQFSQTRSSGSGYDYLVGYNEYKNPENMASIGTEFKFLVNEQWVAGLELRYNHTNLIVTPNLEYNRFGMYCMMNLGEEFFPTIGTYYRF